MGSVSEAERTRSPATVLAIGTANPPHAFDQSTYTDFYFRVTNNDHKHDLKRKFRRICDKSTIRKRHMYLNEEMLKENPAMCDFVSSSLNARQDLLSEKVPELAAEAAGLALKEWGRPQSAVTHLVFCTTGSSNMPGYDCQLIHLLGLGASVQRVPLYHQGCFAGATVLRIAKDLAENNPGSRVLAVCCEITIVGFRGMDDVHFDNLIGQALFGDGAAAVIVGTDPIEGQEKPLFELLRTAQSIVPDSEGAIRGLTRDVGLTFELLSEVPTLIATNMEPTVREAFKDVGVSDWNSVFWAVHPGGPAILDQIEAALGLHPDKLRCSRHVLSEYGNMASACVLFVLDEMRTSSARRGEATTGEGFEWGVLYGFGPGLTVETVLLRAVPIDA